MRVEKSYLDVNAGITRLLFQCAYLYNNFKMLMSFPNPYLLLFLSLSRQSCVCERLLCTDSSVCAIHLAGHSQGSWTALSAVGGVWDKGLAAAHIHPAHYQHLTTAICLSLSPAARRLLPPLQRDGKRQKEVINVLAWTHWEVGSISNIQMKSGSVLTQTPYESLYGKNSFFLRYLLVRQNIGGGEGENLGLQID